MTSRREFIKTSGTFALGTYLLPVTIKPAAKNVGVRLYSLMLADAAGTLKQLAKMGYKELESAQK